MQSAFWFYERLLIFGLNSQSIYTPPFCDTEALCWLAGIIYGSVQATMFPIYRAETLYEHLNGQLEDREGVISWIWQKKSM